MFHSILRASFSATPFIVAARALHFCLYYYVAHLYGLTAETDTAVLALTIATALTAIIAVPVENAFVPIFMNGASRRALGSSPLLWIGSALLIGLGCGAAVGVPRLFATVHAFTQAQRVQLGVYLWGMVPAYAPQLWAAALRARANADNKLGRASAAQALEAAVFLGVVFLSQPFLRLGALPVGYVVSSVFAVLALKCMVRSEPSRLNEPSGARLLSDGTGARLVAVQVGGTAFVALNPLIDQYFAASFGTGALSAYAYASRLVLVPITMIMSGFFPAFLRGMSAMANKAPRWASRTMVLRTALGLAICGLIFTTLAALFASPLVTLFIGRHSTGNSHELTTLLFRVLLCSTVPYVLCGLFTRAHIAFRNSRALGASAAVIVVVNALADFGLSRAMGITGIAISTVCAYIVATMVLYRAFTSWTRQP